MAWAIVIPKEDRMHVSFFWYDTDILDLDSANFVVYILWKSVSYHDNDLGL